MATTYTIYAEQVEDVTKRLDRLAKKAARYGVPFSYKVGEEYPKKITVWTLDPVTHTQHRTGEHTVAAVDVDVDCDAFIKANGWTVRAKVEHGDAGNIVSGIGSKPVKQEWYKATAHCEHCKTNRFRAVTYFCENKDGKIKQVGRSCLKDYTGINPATAAMWAEVQEIFASGMDCTAEEFEERGYAKMYDVETVLAHAYDSIKEFGYRKASDNGSTREEITARLSEKIEPTDEGKEQAKAIVEWLKGLAEVIRAEDETYKVEREKAVAAALADGESLQDIEDPYTGVLYDYMPRLESKVGDLERNCIPLAASGYTKFKGFGRLAYMPIAFEKYKERRAKEAQREAEKAAQAEISSYVGEVGKRLTITTASAKLITSWETAYGVTFLYHFTDETGNVFIWKASRSIDIKDAMTIKGTVKDHSEYDGIKQTVLTRCSVD